MRSHWRHNHPGEAVLLAGGLLIMAVAFPPIPGAVLAGGTALGFAVFSAKLPAAPLLLILALSGTFLLPGAAALALSPGIVGGHPLPGGLPVQWTTEGLRQAVHVSTRALGASAAVLLLVTTTPVPALISLAARLRVPLPILDIIWTVYRFIGMSLGLVGEIRLAQQARLGWRGGWSSIHCAGLLAAALLPALLDRARASEVGLELRGGVTALRPPPSSSKPLRSTRLVGTLALLATLGTITLAMS